MSLAQKLILYALAIALLPLAATGFYLIRGVEGALRERIEVHQQAAAIAVSAKVAQAVEEMARRVSTVVRMMDVSGLSEAERQGLLRMIYQQSDDISAAVLVSRKGIYLAPPEFLTAEELAQSTLAGHPASTTEDVLRLRDNLPPFGETAVPPGTVLMSPAYFPPESSARVAVAVPASFDAQHRPMAVAGVEVALKSEVLRVDGVDTGPQSMVYVVDRTGRAILHPTLRVGRDLKQNGAVDAFFHTKNHGVTRFAGKGGARAAAFAPVGNLGWGVIVEQPESVAYAAVSEMRRNTLIWIGGTLLLVLGTALVFAGRLRKVLAMIVEGARTLGKGWLHHRIDVDTGDEIGELARTMNRMAEALQRSYQELEEWNKTLEDRVEQRTNELKEAHSQLLRQSKLAAIGQLGAGVAHEVNNPLTGILGYVQLMLAGRRGKEEDPETGRLKKIEEAAKRCKQITDNLLRFSERGLAGRSRVSINDIVGEALAIVNGGYEDARIRPVRELGDELPAIVAEPGQVALVLINILNNAKNAIGEKGQVTVRTRAEGEGIHVSIQDTGPGIAEEHLERIFEPFFTTKKVWTGVGMGLSVAYRIVQDHGGKIHAESQPGGGSTFHVWLPTEPPPPPGDEAPLASSSVVSLR